MFVIRNAKGLYWSNETGWGSRESADYFENKNEWNLPIDGYWVRVYRK